MANIGFGTSIDIARQHQYKTNSLHGTKRSHEHIDDITNDKTVASHTSKTYQSNAGCKGRIEASSIYNVADGSIPPNPHIISKPATVSIQNLSQNPLLSLSHPGYGLPQTLVQNFISLGINSIYPWQSSCLLGRGLLEGEKNLVYTAPTGGGKSLVADVLMLKRLVEDSSKKAILVLPYVALVQEKLKWLRKVVEVRSSGANAPCFGHTMCANPIDFQSCSSTCSCEPPLERVVLTQKTRAECSKEC